MSSLHKKPVSSSPLQAFSNKKVRLRHRVEFSSDPSAQSIMSSHTHESGRQSPEIDCGDRNHLVCWLTYIHTWDTFKFIWLASGRFGLFAVTTSLVMFIRFIMAIDGVIANPRLRNTQSACLALKLVCPTGFMIDMVVGMPLALHRIFIRFIRAISLSITPP